MVSWSVEGRGRDPYLQRVGGGWFPFGLDLWFFCRVGFAVVCGDEQLCRLLCGSEARCAAVMWWRVGRSSVSAVPCWCVINMFEKIISLVLMDRASAELLVIGVVFFGGGSLELFLPSWWSLVCLW
ncbi:unnamed protein product [Brassica napus]|uniref:(rape) hypothetical protein n=1 Tax=Brassica napus TaxID=3708 RepID=A0A816I7M5_BRANA|nr:unnamed protein product [Brassica napus]